MKKMELSKGVPFDNPPLGVCWDVTERACFKVEGMTMRKEYRTPAFHFVPHIGDLFNDEIAAMSDEELAAYLKKNQFAEKAKLYLANPDYLLRGIAGEFILVPVGDGVKQLNGMMELNETFQFVWNQFREPHTIYDVVLAAREQFVDSGAMEKDIYDYVEEGLQYGLLKEVEEK